MLTEEGYTMNVILLIQQLCDLLGCRSIETGKQLISNKKEVLAGVTPSDPEGPFCFFVMAAWLKYSPEAAKIAEPLNSAYEARWPNISARNWGLIYGGKALCALHEHRHSDADYICRKIRENANLLDADITLLATADFIQARTAKREGKYVESQQHARAASDGYARAQLPHMVAVTEITLSWVLGQLGEREEADDLRNHAYACLKDTDDRISLGLIHFGRARDLSRRGLDQDALIEFDIAASLLAASPHNLRKVLMDAANLQLRQSKRERKRDPVASRQLSDCATQKLDRVECLLSPNDKRDRVLLFLARSNAALHCASPSSSRARTFSKNAYECAQLLDDQLMLARSLYKRAEVEQSTLRTAVDPWRIRQAAMSFAFAALKEAQHLQNARLTARIHILLGNLYLEIPCEDIEAAAESYEAAADCMARRREDRDFLFEAITRLRTKLEAAQASSAISVIVTVTAGKAFAQPLEKTLQDVEREIVLTVQRHLGAVPHAISKVLQTGHERIVKHLNSLGEQKPATPSDPGDPVIFRVKPRIIFTQPLEKTLRDVEHAIVRAAWLRFGKGKVRGILNIGHERFMSHCANIEAELA
jgi:hypothetical protein